jgi:hypothetical protein
MKMKLKGRGFNTAQAKTKTALKTLTKKHFQDAFKNGRNAGIGTYVPKGTV